ncbi:hypothetical protein ACJX0J_037699, partial [Zea mays]
GRFCDLFYFGRNAYMQIYGFIINAYGLLGFMTKGFFFLTPQLFLKSFLDHILVTSE